jgi:hypothetical protein
MLENRVAVLRGRAVEAVAVRDNPGGNKPFRTRREGTVLCRPKRRRSEWTLLPMGRLPAA